MKVLTIGGATQDMFLEYAPQTAQLPTPQGQRCFLVFEEGKKVELENIAYYTGGGATNSAASFKKLGFDVASFFKIGTDPQGDYILRDLEERGISNHAIIQTSTTPTALSIIIPCPSGDRTILAYRGANRTLTANELPLATLHTYDQLYITSLSGSAGELIIPLTQAAQQSGIPVAVNPGSSQLKMGAQYLAQALPAIDILILNKFEAELLYQSLHTAHHDFSIKSFCRAILGRGPRIVVVTHDVHGVYCATEEHVLFHPSMPVHPISSVGAGDAFGSTFVATLLQGASLEDAMRYGVINAASVITNIGAKTGLLSAQELEQEFKKLDKNLLQRS